MKTIRILDPSLLLLVGSSGSGKSSFAEKHFKPTEIISSDECRALISDDPNNQACSSEAFEVLHFIVNKRLEAGKLTVVDATNLDHEYRLPLRRLARKNHILTHALVFHFPLNICLAQNQKRATRIVPEDIVIHQHQLLSHAMKNISKREGFFQVDLLTPENIKKISLQRITIPANKTDETGCFDIIGDVHGCIDELILLLTKLGYQIKKESHYQIDHPQGRRLIFVGDLVDRGPDAPGVLKLVMDVIQSNQGFCVKGNHDNKLKQKLLGSKVKVAHGLEFTLQQFERETEEFKAQVVDFLSTLNAHYLLDKGKLAVCHAGIKEKYLGRSSPRIDSFCLYGDTTGETDELGLPIRHPWANDYRGDTIIVYGHTPISEPEWVNNTINIDTGCVFGGKLTALRYPENEIVSVHALKTYYKPTKPIK